MTSVHKFRRFHILISLKKTLKSILIECSNRFTQISIDFRIIEIKILINIICNDPRIDRILWQIRKRSITSLIKIHKILKITNLSSLPLNSNILKLINFKTINRYSLRQNIIYLIPISLTLKSKVITFTSTNLKTNLS